VLFYSYLTKAKLHNMNCTRYSQVISELTVFWKHSLHNKIVKYNSNRFRFCIQNMLFTLKYILLTKQVLRSTYTKIAQWKMLQQGIYFPAPKHPFAVDFQRSWKLIENLPVKTSKLHSHRPKKQKANKQTPKTSWNRNTTDHFARKQWHTSLSFMLKCQLKFYVKINFI